MKLWIPGKTRLIILATFTFTLYIHSIYFNCSIYDILHLKRYIVRDLRTTNTTRKILFWNTMFGDEHFYMGKDDIFLNCPVTDCYATHDRYYTELLDFDAILFHGNELELADLPKTRGSRQWYVFVNLESPVNRPLTSDLYEDFFNLTMTYRLDSDVVWTYGAVKEAHTGRIVAPRRNTSWNEFYDRLGDRDVDHRDASLSRVIGSKSKPIVWFVSNCMARSGRQEYANELSKHITVDVYGRCGSRYCPHNEDCFAEVAEPEYFFYLSFENTLCDDYVTEKLYNALRYNIVPIVYGGANYSLFAPPRSYINALDFDTPKDLANYLRWLMKHPREYSEYFAWKKYYKISGGISTAVCDLCQFLHERKEPRMYNFLSDWYSRSKCPLQELLQRYAYVTGSTFKHKD